MPSSRTIAAAFLSPKLLDQRREFVVGDLRRLDGHLAGEFQRGLLGGGPRRKVPIPERLDRGVVQPRRGGRRRRRTPRRSHNGSRGRRPSAWRPGVSGRAGSWSAGRGRAPAAPRSSSATSRPASGPRTAGACRTRSRPAAGASRLPRRRAGESASRLDEAGRPSRRSGGGPRPPGMRRPGSRRES